MQWSNLLQPKRNTTSIRFRAMMESGQFVDETADIVQTQVLAHRSRASIRNRDSVPLYFHTEEDRPPTWRENLLVETGLSQPPDTDSRYIMEDSRNLHKGLRTGAVELDGDSQLQAHLMKIVANVAAVVVFAGCLWYAGLGAGPETIEVEVAAEEAVMEEYGHGFVEQVQGPGGEEGGEGPQEAGAGGEAEGGADLQEGGRGPGGDAEDQAEPGGGPEQDQAPDVEGAP